MISHKWLFVSQLLVVVTLISATESFCTSRGFSRDRCGFQNPISTVNDLQAAIRRNFGRRIFIFFRGTPEHGVHWCGCCARAEPEVRDAARYLPTNSVLLVVNVGNRNQEERMLEVSSTVPTKYADFSLVDARRLVMNYEDTRGVAVTILSFPIYLSVF
ncbi:hypothetical protein D915_006860 [Fasciola hepatica]|uniref:Thioredoxin domain-containing protein 17 n=1 Tax=Fasciola hepatica TaxID=6192 RepID=A0A4E0R5E8_FASHE|nr:hypothetical protein D915_006860 [Fasciola hepatica]